MASIYDNIKTATELVSYVRFHGMSTKQEDICRAQDIIGHSDIEELDNLANDIGRNDENGNPDPKGTVSSGRMETRSTFYSILFHIWNWEDATRFWNQHSNPEYKELNVLRKLRGQLNEQVRKLIERRDELLKDSKLAGEHITELNARIADEKARAEAAEAEITKLKARLYDLLVTA